MQVASRFGCERAVGEFYLGRAAAFAQRKTYRLRRQWRPSNNS